MSERQCQWWVLAALGALALGCGGSASERDRAAAAEPELDADDWTRQWRRLALPDPRYSDASIARTPSGWLVAAAGAQDTFVYRSADGVRWERVTFTDHDAELRLTGVAYGNDRHVVVGHPPGLGNLVLSSRSGEHWDQSPGEDPDAFGLDGVQFVGGRFFGRGIDLWSSADAIHWVHSKLDGFFDPKGVAFGAGRYLAVGLGAPQLSSNGIDWSPAPIDCALTTACFSDDSESPPMNQYRSVLFAAGHFYLAGLRSPDGKTWQELEGPAPTGYLSGRFLRLDFEGTQSEGTLSAWAEGGTPEPIDVLPPPEVRLPGEGDIPDRLDYSWSDGLDCTSARCVALGRELYLIPRD